MKKILALLSAVSFVILAGCSSGSEVKSTTAPNATKAEETTLFPEFSTIASKADVVSRVRDVRNTLYYNGNERIGEYNNTLNIPALNIAGKGASAINQKIMQDSVKDIEFFDEIKANNNLIKTNDSQGKTAVISHKWRSFNKLTVIEVHREYGVINGSTAENNSSLYYYDRGNDKELTFDEMLVKLGTTKDELFKKFSAANPKETGFTKDSIKGIFPDTDELWHIMLDNGSKFMIAELKLDSGTTTQTATTKPAAKKA